MLQLMTKQNLRRSVRAALGAILLVATLATTSSQSLAKVSLSPFAQDLAYMIQMLEAVHPNLYYVYPKTSFYADIDLISHQMLNSTDLLEVWKKVMPLLHRLRDGHTFAFRPDQKLLTRMSDPSMRLFPVAVDITEQGQMFVKKPFLESLRQGDEILAINQLSMPELLSRLQVFVSGELPLYWYTQLAEDFGTYLWLSGGSHRVFELAIRRGTEHMKVSISGQSLDELRRSWGPLPESKPEDYSFSVLDKTIGFMRLPHFSDPTKFKAFLTRSLNEFKTKHLKHLIIDIRGNGGGNSALGKELMAHITQRPFRQYAEVQIKVSAPIKAYYGCSQSTTQTCWPALRDAPLGSILKSTVPFSQPYSQRFAGKVAVLIDHDTFSSAADFAAMVKDFAAGVLIGQETGGLASSFGDVYRFNLPHTQLGIGVSHKYFVRPSGEMGLHGVRPDFPITLTASPRSSQDEQLNFARHVLTQQAN